MERRSPLIVVVDDDPWARATLNTVLSPVYPVQLFESPQESEVTLGSGKSMLLILDLNLKGQSGLDWLKKSKATYPQLDVILCSGESKVERAIECMREGAADYVVKPFKPHDLLFTVRRVIEKKSLEQKVERLAPLIFPRPAQWVGNSNAANPLLQKISQLVQQTHLNVLLLGESGTGKEIVARLLHQQENESGRPFVVANMPAIPPSLMEAELFGVEKGAFTDAKIPRPGKFELADGGDLFLDEIGDLPFEMQAKLLRTLQEHQVERVGSHVTRDVQFRIISATNRPISSLMAQGEFREDLLYRLSDVVLWIPPLRGRKDDIPNLCRFFIQKYFRGPQEKLPTLGEGALKVLLAYDWPGNVRQLESTIKRALVFNRASVLETIEIYDLKFFNFEKKTLREDELRSETQSYEHHLEDYERSLLTSTLQKFNGDKRAARESLKLSRATFYRKLSDLKVPLSFT